MAQTIDVCEGFSEPRPKYQYIINIDGIDSFFIDFSTFHHNKKHKTVYITLEEAISPKGAQFLINKFSQFSLLKHEIIKKFQIKRMDLCGCVDSEQNFDNCSIVYWLSNSKENDFLKFLFVFQYEKYQLLF